MEYETIYPDEELYEDEDVEALEDEGSNRTFIILVGSLGGLLAVAICIFVVWAFVINPRMSTDRVAQNQSIEATNEAILLTSQPQEEDATNTPRAAPTDEPESTATPAPPTATPKPPTPTRAQPTPTTASGGNTDSTVEEATPAAVAEAEATNTPRPATATPRPTKTGVPETGIGALGYGALAVGLLFLLLVARRLRRAT